MTLRRNPDSQAIEAEEILTKQVLFQTTILFFLPRLPPFFSFLLSSNSELPSPAHLSVSG